MTVTNGIFAFAGVFIWAGLAMWYQTQNELWLIIPAFVGFNMFQTSFTGFCPLGIILKKVGFKSSK